jgi:hypothetical protein
MAGIFPEYFPELFRLIRLPTWGLLDKSGITQVVLATSPGKSKPGDKGVTTL